MLGLAGGMTYYPRGLFLVCNLPHAAAAMSAKRKSYCVSFKLKAIETAEKKSKEAAARESGVDAKRI